MNPEQELERARQAQRWLDDSLFKAARDDIYDRLKAHRRAAATTDTLLHSKLILLEQVADQFFGYFEQLAQTGKFAADFIEQQDRQRKSFADRMASYVQWGRSGV